MFFSILKKDIKRKKTMNCIILLFVILSSMFFSSGANNIISIAGGVDRFLDAAGAGDHIVLLGQPESGESFSEKLDRSADVSGYREDIVLTISSDAFKFNGDKADFFANIGLLQTVSENGLTLFDENNEPVRDVPKGKVLVTSAMSRSGGMKEGDRLTFELCGEKIELEYGGIVKDAVLGSPMAGNSRFVVNKEDFESFMKNKDIAENYRFGIYCIDCNNKDAITDIIKDEQMVMLTGERSLIKTTYILYMIVAGIVMTVSICLIMIAFVVLRFTISFTITEEFREIGVMKAIGLKNSSVRSLYLVKYLGISVAGAVTGFFASLPFGKILLDSVSSDIILENGSEYLIGAVCSAGVVIIIMLFCWMSTAKIKKLSPIDAVRSGQTGERFNRKGCIHLSKTRLRANTFLSLNEIMSTPKQTAILTAVFTFCTLLIIVLSTTANTLAGEGLITALGCTKSDVYINLQSEDMNIMSGTKTIDETCRDIEKTLAENGMPAKVRLEALYTVPVRSGDKSESVRFMICRDTDTSDYPYTEGTAPQYPNEIALGNPIAESFDVSVGDKLMLTINGEEQEFIITGLFDSMSQLGKCGRFTPDVDIPDNEMTSAMAFQADFDDNPDAKTIDERVSKLKKIYDTNSIYNTAEYVDDCTKSADTINAAKILTMTISIIVSALICVLIETSFISKEKTDIALMKAIGFRNRSITCVHTVRFLIIGVLSIVLAILLSAPATKFMINPIFAIMGATNGMNYEINKSEIFVTIPAIMLAVITASVFITSLRTRAVKSSDSLTA
ncbi:MAG: ABC transporter permease [Ruminococcus sp.]|nr:ABC transporter permease [Ruminococcus sp.]